MKHEKQMGLFWLHPSYRSSMLNMSAFIFMLACIQLLAWLIPDSSVSKNIASYLPVHTLLETISVVVSMMLFAVGWNSHNEKTAGNVVLLACVFFSVAVLDFLHTTSYVGMPDLISPNDSQKHLNFWMVARIFASVSLLIVAIRRWKPFTSSATRYLIFSTLIIITITVGWVTLYHQAWLPDWFIKGEGLTQLKKNIEYMIVVINIVTAMVLWIKMREPQPFNVVLLFGAVCVMGMSEFFFTLYTTMSGSYNVLGHVYKAIAYLFIYRALVVQVIETPYHELEQSQQKLSLSLRASNTGLWDWNLTTNNVDFSPEWKMQLGYQPDDLKNDFATWESLLHPEDSARAIRKAQDFAVSPQILYENEFRLRHADGSYRWIMARGEKLTDVNSSEIRLIGSHVDITERIQAELQFRSVVEASPNAIIMVDALGNIILCNSETSNMFGYSKDELQGVSLNILLPDKYQQSHSVQVKAFVETLPDRHKMGLGRELYGIHKDGRSIPIEVILSFLKNSDGHFGIATISDISERKKIEAEAIEMREHLIQATKMESIGHLTAGIAHDFNNILGAMIGYTDLARHSIASGNLGAVDRYHNNVLVAGERAKQLIAQMMTFSRLSPSVEGTVAPSILLTPVVKEVVSLLRSSIPSTVDLNYIIETEDLKARIQPIHLHQILLNLGVNARDALGEYGKIDITLSRRHYDNALCSSCNTEFAGDYAQITVKDSGAGIENQILNKIFDPFYTTKDVGKGTGMGLSVVHGLVHAMGGHIQVESGATSGSAFNILLPLAESEIQIPDMSDAVPLANIKGARIMVVDDEQVLATMIHEFLSAHGAHIISFTDPITALETFSQSVDSIDLVITDETMPGMSGMLLAEKLLKLKPGLPIILCTGFSEHATADSVNKIGIAGFFYKPLNMNDLILKIQSLLKVQAY